MPQVMQGEISKTCFTYHSFKGCTEWAIRFPTQVAENVLRCQPGHSNRPQCLSQDLIHRHGATCTILGICGSYRNRAPSKIDLIPCQGQ